MISKIPVKVLSPGDRIQGSLLSLAALFLFFINLELSIAPVVRLHSWEGNFRWTHWLGYLLWLGLFTFIHRQTIHFLPDRDPYLLPVTALLTGWGLLTIWRLAPDLGFRQTLWTVFSALLVVILIRLPDPLVYLRRYKYLCLVSGLTLTGLTFIFGTFPGGNGPHLWLGCCGVYLQPSEPLKFLLIAYVAAYLADRLPKSLNLLETALPSLVLTGLALALLLVQRDLGTACLFIALYAVILFAATGRRRILLLSFFGVGLAGLAGYLLFDVVHLRIDAWLNPWLDSSGRSYQIVQSLMAVANGGIFGRGIGLGSPGLVPVAQSDFIFSAIAEETGLIGSLSLILLLGLFAVRGFRTALHAPNAYARYLAAGLTSYLVGQSVLIIAGNLRLLPLTGVTLPFISYGGSSLVTSFIAFTAILIISSQAQHESSPLFVTQAYRILVGLLLIALLATSLADGWWAVWRAPSLLSRNDNPRRTVNDRYVLRGSLLDLHGSVLSQTTGKPGEYHRAVLYPPLSPIIGYTHPIYGQAALELAFDPFLRGLQGYPFTTEFWNQLVYGQPPPGLDVRLSLSLPLQIQADSFLADHSGAVVLLNAQNGEILVIASHPYFDANTLDQNWDSLVKDPQSPLVNRATQGLYQPGTALMPFLLALGNLPDKSPDSVVNDYAHNGISLSCSFPLSPPFTQEMISTAGCPFALLSLSNDLTDSQLISLFQKLGFYQAPSVSLPVAQPLIVPSQLANRDLYRLGQSDLSISPLQMALAAATLNNNGLLPSPQLILGIKSPEGSWTIPTSEQASSSQVFTLSQAKQAVQAMVQPNQHLWNIVGTAQNSPVKKVTWFIGGTPPEWQGQALVLVILLEEDNPTLAQQIGQTLLYNAMAP